MARRRRINPRNHKRRQTMTLVQIILLATILFMVLFFRDGFGTATSAFLGAFGQGEDLRVAPKPSGRPAAETPPSPMP